MTKLEPLETALLSSVFKVKHAKEIKGFEKLFVKAFQENAFPPSSIIAGVAAVVDEELSTSNTKTMVSVVESILDSGMPLKFIFLEKLMLILRR
jgi:hypothetical protein